MIILFFCKIGVCDIHDAVYLAEEAIHTMKKEKQSNFVLKIDLSKAHDRVNWTFLHLLLIQIGIPMQLVHWIMDCIQSTSFVLLINGYPSRFFRSSRGLRQGCPLSPFLVLLVAEALSRIIHRAKVKQTLKGVWILNLVKLTHILFVDDVLLRGRVFFKDSNIILKYSILGNFSGLKKQVYR